jgi:hypothetical protein
MDEAEEIAGAAGLSWIGSGGGRGGHAGKRTYFSSGCKENFPIDLCNMAVGWRRCR